MLDVGTWGIGLFANDTAADLRDDFRSVVRAPWNGDRRVAWAIARYPSATDPADTDYPVLWLAITDLFWTYGIDHPETFSRAEQVIADGTDLAALRLLGMAPRDLDRRARVLAGLAERWRTPNPEARPRRVLASAQRFMLDVGDVLAYRWTATRCQPVRRAANGGTLLLPAPLGPGSMGRRDRAEPVPQARGLHPCM